MLSNALKFAIAWILLAMLLAAPPFLVSFRYLRDVARIRDDPATAVGAFTAKDCAHHASRSYQFDVAGKNFHGGGASEAGGDCQAVRIGGPILVHYERGNPASNIGGSPAAALENEIVTMALIGLLFPPFILWRLRRWRARGGWFYWGWPVKP